MGAGEEALIFVIPFIVAVVGAIGLRIWYLCRKNNKVVSTKAKTMQPEGHILELPPEVLKQEQEQNFQKEFGQIIPIVSNSHGGAEVAAYEPEWGETAVSGIAYDAYAAAEQGYGYQQYAGPQAIETYNGYGEHMQRATRTVSSPPPTETYQVRREQDMAPPDKRERPRGPLRIPLAQAPITSRRARLASAYEDGFIKDVMSKARSRSRGPRSTTSFASKMRYGRHAISRSGESTRRRATEYRGRRVQHTENRRSGLRHETRRAGEIGQEDAYRDQLRSHSSRHNQGIYHQSRSSPRQHMYAGA